MGINVAQFVRQWALRDGGRTALVLPGATERARQSISYAELDQRAMRSAEALQRAGFEVGARIAVCVPNGVGFLDAFFGGLYAGCTLVPVPPMSAPPELAQRLAHGRCAGLITDARTHELGEKALDLSPGAAHLSCVKLLSEPLADDAGPRDLPAGAVAMLLYTSGTTGVAKGAMITHASLATHTAALVHHVLRLSDQDRVLAALPLTHSYGIRMTLLAPFYAGAQSVLLERFEATLVSRVMETEGITWFPGVPTMFHALTQQTDQPTHEWPSLRWCLSAGAPLAPEIRRRFEKRHGVPLRQGFGLTEATFSTIAQPLEAPASGLRSRAPGRASTLRSRTRGRASTDEQSEQDAGADSVGEPVFGVEVRICDDTGGPLSAGMRGEIWVRGQNVMAGYFDDPEATEQVMRDGWLRTGDVGVLDPAGRLSVVDRIKDLIVRGGFNVYPAEVEAVLLAHPDVHQVVVVGVADERYGEEVVAAVVPRAGVALDPDGLTAHCRQQLSSTKLPRLWAELTAIPMGPSGKLLRRAIKTMVARGDLHLLRASG